MIRVFWVGAGMTIMIVVMGVLITLMTNEPVFTVFGFGIVVLWMMIIGFIIKRLIQNHPLAVWHDTLSIYYLNRQPQKALEHAEKAIAYNPRLMEAYHNRGNAHLVLQHPRNALLDYQQALRYFPDFDGTRLMIGRAYLVLEEYDKALEILNEVKSPGKFLELFSLMRGSAYSALYQFEKAQPDLEQAQRLQPRNPLVLQSLAFVMARQQRWEECFKLLDQTLELTQHNAPLRAMMLNSQGYYRAHQGDYAASLDDLNQAVTLDASNAFAYGSRGHTHYLMGNYELALADFRQATTHKPEEIAFSSETALILFKLNRHEEARQVWNSLPALRKDEAIVDELQKKYFWAAPFLEDLRAFVAQIAAQGNPADTKPIEPSA